MSKQQERLPCESEEPKRNFYGWCSPVYLSLSFDSTNRSRVTRKERDLVKIYP